MRWEWDLLGFLRRELAPSPARWRATLRTTRRRRRSRSSLIMALDVPEGEFLLVTLFVLTPADAGASLEKARLRAAARSAAARSGCWASSSVADKPWLFVPLQALVIGVAMFLARTTTAPYAFILGAVTFVMVLPLYPTTPAANVEIALWRTGLTTLGVLIATGAQLVLWPDDPEVLLLDDLAGRVRDTQTLLARLRARPGDGSGCRGGRSRVTGVTGQLDLLKNAETRSRWLRQRHTEQIALIATRPAPGDGGATARAPRRRRARSRHGRGRASSALAHACAQVAARSPRAGRWTAPDAAVAGRDRAAGLASDLDLEAAAALEELERALDRAAGTSPRFSPGRHHDRPRTGAGARAGRRAAPAHARVHACANVEAIRFALKVALAATICGILLEATNLPGSPRRSSRARVIAQSFVGAGLRKALLRVTGAARGRRHRAPGDRRAACRHGDPGVLSRGRDRRVRRSPPGWSPAAAASATSGSRWRSCWRSRSSRRGARRPTSRRPADRILGVLLGILVMGVVDVTLWPVFGETALRRTLADALRQMAELHRVAARRRRRRAGASARSASIARSATRSRCTTTSRSSPAAATRATVHGALLRVVSGGVERLFLDLLALGRHRPTAVPPRGGTGARATRRRHHGGHRGASRGASRSEPGDRAGSPPRDSRRLRTVEPLREFAPALRRRARRARRARGRSGRPRARRGCTAQRPRRRHARLPESPTANASAAAELSSSARLSITRHARARQVALGREQVQDVGQAGGVARERGVVGVLARRRAARARSRPAGAPPARRRTTSTPCAASRAASAVSSASASPRRASAARTAFSRAKPSKSVHENSRNPA